MSKVLIRLTQLLLILSFVSLFLPKITLAVDCDFHFYDPSDKEIEPNVNMGNLKIKVESGGLRATSYAAVLYTPMTIESIGRRRVNIILPANETADFRPNQPSYFTFQKLGDWGTGNYKVFVIESQVADIGAVDLNELVQRSKCTTSFPLDTLPREEDCKTFIENSPQLNNFPIYPGTPVSLHVVGAQDNCTVIADQAVTGGYDIYIEGRRKGDLKIYCPNTTGDSINLGTFDYLGENKSYTIELRSRCIGDIAGTCIPQLRCNQTQINVLLQGSKPPDQTPQEPPGTPNSCKIAIGAAHLPKPAKTDPVSVGITNLVPNQQGFKINLTNKDQSTLIKQVTGGSNSQGILAANLVSHLDSGVYLVTVAASNDNFLCKEDFEVTEKGSLLKQWACPGNLEAKGDCKPTTAGKDSACGSDENPAIKTAIGCIHTSPAEFTKDMMKFVIGISGGLAFLMMLLGAFQMLTSAGNPETLQAGRERLTSAIIGLLIVLFAVLLLQIIGVGILNIPGFS